MNTLHYKLAIYAPRSEDPSETTVITPVPGSAHADPLQVSTLPVLAGHKPYLFYPSGRGGEMDLRKRKTDTGTLSFRLLDPRAAGGTNLQRWITAYTGDAKGRNRLHGCKAVAWESVDGGATWSPFWTGRIHSAEMDSAVSFNIVVKENAKALNDLIYQDRPHASITYAHPCNVLPNPLVVPYLTGTTAPWASGTIDASGQPFATGRQVKLTTAGAAKDRLIITKLLRDLDEVPYKSYGSTREDGHPSAFVRLKRTDTGTVGWFRLARVRGTMHRDPARYIDWARYDVLNQRDDGIKCAIRVGIQEMLPVEAGYMAMPPTGTAVEIFVADGLPLLISDVHPVRLILDWCGGYFSRLQADGSVDPARVVTVNSTPAGHPSIAQLLADQSFPPIRLRISEAERRRDAINNLCLYSGLGWRMNGAGELELLDLRLPSSVPVAPTISDADLIPGESHWGFEGAEQATRLEATYYLDRGVSESELIDSDDEFPDVPAGMLREEAVPYMPVDLAAEAVEDKSAIEVDAKGLRGYVLPGVPEESRFNRPAGEWARAHLDALEVQLRGPFAAAPQYVTLVCHRAESVKGCRQGDLRYVNVSRIPNTSTRTRGGLQLVRVTKATFDGPRVKLECLVYPTSLAGPPTLGALTATTNGAVATPTVNVTKNAAGETVQVQVAVTAMSVGVRPGETAGDWGHGVFVDWIGGAVSLPPVSVGFRVWVRARTYPAPQARDLPRYPSAWVFPTGTGYIDAVDTPRLIGARVIVDDATGAADIVWTGSPSTSAVRCYYGVGPADSPPLVLPSSFDTNQTTPAIPGLTVARGDLVRVEVEPWSGWTGSAVTGTSGPRSESFAARANAPDPTVTEPSLTVTKEAEDEDTETWRIVASVAPGASTPLRWRVQSYASSAPQQPYIEVPGGSVNTTFQLFRSLVRIARFRATVLDGDGRDRHEPIEVSPKIPAIDKDSGRINPVTPVGVGPRTIQGIDDDAARGKVADDDLQGMHTSGVIDRVNRRLLRLRDTTAGVDVTGATARMGSRLVDPADTAVKLPPTEVADGNLPSGVKRSDGQSIEGTTAAQIKANLARDSANQETTARGLLVNGTLRNDVGASDGAAIKPITKGMLGPFAAYNGATFEFDPPYQDVPPISLGLWNAMETRPVWGTRAAVDAGTATGAFPAAYIRLVDLGTLSAAAYSPALYWMAEGVAAQRKFKNFSAPLTTSTIGATTGPALPLAADVPSADGKFKAAFKVSVFTLAENQVNGTVVVALLVYYDGGDSPTEIATYPVSYSISGPDLPGDWESDELIVEGYAPGVVGGDDEFRLQLKSKTGDANATLAAVNLPNWDGLSWQADPGAIYAKAAPGGARHGIPVTFAARS